VKLQELKLFKPIHQRVQIAQKTVKDQPIDKLYDSRIAILAGAHGLVGINTRLRADRALQAAFGRSRCAEQSVVQQTLDAATPQNVQQMEAALDKIYRQHSQGYRHDYRQSYQVLDIDLSGMPCGAKAAFVSKGYFAKQRNRRGRQLGRALASHYDEVVVDHLFEGTMQLNRALIPLLQAAEQTLQLDQARRSRTIVRLDTGGGTLEDLNWLLSQGYHFIAKEYSGKRAQRLAQSVTWWADDPKVAGRQIGWVHTPAPEYGRPVRRLAVRTRKANGQWAIGVLITTLSPVESVQLTQQPAAEPNSTPEGVLLAYATFYDQRGGGIETSFKGDKQGLGLTKRSKKHVATQQMVMLLGTLAHNIVVWAQRWLAVPQLTGYGMLRMVRDVFHLSGFLLRDAAGSISQIVLNTAAPLALVLRESLAVLLASTHVAVILDKT
jgi:hypothetical protein